MPLGVTYAVTPDYVEEGPVSPGLVWGPSMAFRRRVFDAGHRFDPAVGPQPGNYRMGAETEFTERLGRLGYKAWFVPRAEVQHIIRPNQMDPNWIVRRAYRFGRDIYWKEREKADNAGGAGFRTAPRHVPLALAEAGRGIASLGGGPRDLQL